MKKWIASVAALCTSLVLLTPNAFAAIGQESLLDGSARTFAYWVLGICSIIFFALVAIWSWNLRSTVKTQDGNQPAYLAARRQR